MNIKPCMGHISGTWELLLCEYWRKCMIIGEKNTDLKRLTGWLKFRFLTEIGRLHWNQGEEVAHFAWFGEPWHCIFFTNVNNAWIRYRHSISFLTNKCTDFNKILWIKKKRKCTAQMQTRGRFTKTKSKLLVTNKCFTYLPFLFLYEGGKVL